MQSFHDSRKAAHPVCPLQNLPLPFTCASLSLRKAWLTCHFVPSLTCIIKWLRCQVAQDLFWKRSSYAYLWRQLGWEDDICFSRSLRAFCHLPFEFSGPGKPPHTGWKLLSVSHLRLLTIKTTLVSTWSHCKLECRKHATLRVSTRGLCKPIMSNLKRPHSWHNTGDFFCYVTVKHFQIQNTLNTKIYNHLPNCVPQVGISAVTPSLALAQAMLHAN